MSNSIPSRARVEWNQRGHRASASDLNWRAVAKYGALGGSVSGLAFSVAGSVMAWLMGMPWLACVAMVAAIVMGPQVMESATSTSVGAILLWGMGLHLMYVIITGVLFATLIGFLSKIRRSGRAVFVSALLYTMILWLTNFYWLAPRLGWYWFPAMTQVWSEFILHVVVWGGVLGLYFSRPSVRLALMPSAD